MADEPRILGRVAYQGRAWRRAAAALGAADGVEELGADDLTMLAEAAFLSGDPAGCVRAYERVFQAHAAQGAVRAAARVAFWVGLILASRGAPAAAGGWLGRAGRLLDRYGEDDCAERGYLLLPVARGHYAAGRYLDTLRVARSVEAIGRRHGEGDLVTFAQHQQGRALLRLERLEEGLGVLDEVFVEVFPVGLTSPLLTGMVACSVLEGCQQVGAFDRAGEWTAALSAWCDEQSELVPFSGECLVHRAEVLLRRGHWLDSLAEARAAARCAERDGLAAPAAAAAYQQGEALRRLGRLQEAERAYLAAQRAGHDPMPGLARLRLEQHRRQVALASIERALAVAEDPLQRAHLLPAAVEVVLAADQSAQAVAYVRELSELALRWPAPGLRAAALQASGAVALAGGDAARAATVLAEAWGCWTSQQAPFEAAQTRLLLGRACAALGDREASAAHHTAAEAALTALQSAATKPTARTDQRGAQPVGLSTREAQVLQLVATGRTNRAIAERLVLSERTVDRHVSNILGKLKVATRTQAAAFAFAHGLA